MEAIKDEDGTTDKIDSPLTPELNNNSSAAEHTGIQTDRILRTSEDVGENAVLDRLASRLNAIGDTTMLEPSSTLSTTRDQSAATPNAPTMSPLTTATPTTGDVAHHRPGASTNRNEGILSGVRDYEITYLERPIEDLLAAPAISSDDFNNLLLPKLPHAHLKDGIAYLISCGRTLTDGNICGYNAERKRKSQESPFMRSAKAFSGHRHYRFRAKERPKGAPTPLLATPLSHRDATSIINGTIPDHIMIKNECGEVSYNDWKAGLVPYPRCRFLNPMP